MEDVIPKTAVKMEAAAEEPVAGDVETPKIRSPRYEEERMFAGRSEKISLKKFDGTNSWEDFFCQFQRASKVNRWRDEDRVELLCLHLEGMSLEFVNGLPLGRVQRFDDLVAALRGRFGTERMATVFKCELRQRRQKKGESLPDLGQDLRRLMRLAYPQATPEQQEEQIIDRFIEALTDKTQRLEVRRGRPNTLEQAIHLAMDAEAWELEEEENGKRARAATVEPQLVDPLQTLLLNLTQMLTKLGEKLDAPTGGTKGSGKCFQCGQAGHFKHQCPQLAGNGQQSQ